MYKVQRCDEKVAQDWLLEYKKILVYQLLKEQHNKTHRSHIAET